MPSKRDRLESAYYKKEEVTYNKYNHSYVHNKQRDKRREENIDKFGVEREPLSKEELEALIRKQEEEALLLQKKNDLQVKDFDEKEWFGDEDDSDHDGLEEVTDSDDEPAENENGSKKKVRFMEEALDFQEEDDGTGSSFIVISNLHKDVNAKKFKNTFEEAGRIKSVCFPTSSANKSLGWAIIEYYSAEVANQAVQEYHKAENRGKILKVMKFNMINDFFVIQNDDDDIEVENAQELKNSINMKQWNAASSLLKEKMLLFLRWKMSDNPDQKLSEREEIVLSLLEEQEKSRMEQQATKQARRASKKRKLPIDSVRPCTGGLWQKQKNKRRKKK
uniref:RRM domain-containing protein n=1 Tax=Percolomonas cosmopolitus TaxID=63605 RepID=A0A7S1PH76_9EUKA|eukprot:CAMPEP_0117444032 /NCGR_PEP_ID=MMETSP0759-20121206/5019_1 /TAXON_ID=63605 /ORGANISM="Percolomonas cosmopolitus, Strain WS" /LENGTH=333 /DNA_ID=CAMNT_0005236061 /DNA_START=38 /DNA_END=1039 /DNA_ORIENTATION=+